MKNIFAFSVLIAFLLLASCSPGASVDSSQGSTPTVLPEITPTISFQTETVTRTTPTTSSVEQCVGSRQGLPKNLEGNVVLGGKNSISQFSLDLLDTPPYMLALATGDKLILPQQNEEQVKNFLVSPDKKWLAYYAQQSGTEGQVYILGNDGTLFKKYPAGDWWGILEWFDNNHLLISKRAHQNPYPTLVFNAFTGKTEQELIPNYPDIFTGYSGELYSWDRFHLPETVYNSDLNMVVYPKNPNTIVLWDIKANREIVEITDRSASSQAPLWLSNEKEFIIDITAENTPDHWLQDELMSVRIDGQVRQLTHLVDLFRDVAIQPRYSESADGRYISFWFIQVGGSGPSTLAIYDMSTETTKVFCLSIGGYFPPIWSPSKHQLLIDGTFDSLNNYGTIFIDVESELMAQVEKGVIPVGWMISP